MATPSTRDRQATATLVTKDTPVSEQLTPSGLNGLTPQEQSEVLRQRMLKFQSIISKDRTGTATVT